MNKVLCVSLLILPSTLAMADSGDDRKRLLAALEATGCTVTSKELGIVGTELGLENYDFELMLDSLFAEGLIVISGEVFKLKTEKCN